MKETYEQKIVKIEEIMAKFRRGEMSVDELATEVKRATELIAQCKEQLIAAEEELKKVIEE